MKPLFFSVSLGLFIAKAACADAGLMPNLVSAGSLADRARAALGDVEQARTFGEESVEALTGALLREDSSVETISAGRASAKNNFLSEAAPARTLTQSEPPAVPPVEEVPNLPRKGFKGFSNGFWAGFYFIETPTVSLTNTHSEWAYNRNVKGVGYYGALIPAIAIGVILAPLAIAAGLVTGFLGAALGMKRTSTL